MLDGLGKIEEERARQVARGHGSEQDDLRADTELAMAAICYGLRFIARRGRLPRMLAGNLDHVRRMIMPWSIPEDPQGNDFEDLAKMGALAAAEMDRLARRAERSEVTGQRSEPVPGYRAPYAE